MMRTVAARLKAALTVRYLFLQVEVGLQAKPVHATPSFYYRF